MHFRCLKLTGCPIVRSCSSSLSAQSLPSFPGRSRRSTRTASLSTSSKRSLPSRGRYYTDTVYSIPVILNGTGLIPPATAENYVPWSIIGFIFQYVIRRRHFSWWSKYNCTQSVLLRVLNGPFTDTSTFYRRSVRCP